MRWEENTMKIIVSLLLIILIGLSSGLHLYFVWRERDRKTLCIQIGLIGVAMLVGIMIIFGIQDPSLSSMLNYLSPLDK